MRIGMTPHGKPDLTDPEVSLTLAQEYIGELTGNAGIGRSLLLIAAAYNSGPAPIQRWLASPELRQDPLLFVESIPSRETRTFTHQVMANFWIYRQRLGQPTPDLDALAAGRWPTYTAFDAPSGQGSRYAAN
jgi:soluble lytic murein transglycosylase-like protein